MTQLPASWLSWFAYRRWRELRLHPSVIGLGAALALLLSSCVDDGSGRLPPVMLDGDPPPTRMCLDEDGDGFGVGCAAGVDCDDNDPAVTTECLCHEPNPGCSCDEPGELAACGRAYAKIGSQLLCGEGVMRCSDGKWGECIINQAVQLKRQKSLTALGDPTPCENNPCDPRCTEFIDLVGSIGADGGVVESDAGLTLRSGGEAPPAGPPSGGGFGCTGGRYPQHTGACDHHVCETGEVLDPECDGVESTSTPILLFEDTFSDSSLGWSLDPTWEIGYARSSSGQSFGGGDPNQDTTPGNDNRIAGTVLGGNIGGGGTLFFDTFSNLNDWNATNWSTSTLRTSTGYPSSGSGSYAAHGSPSCFFNWCFDTAPTLTLRSSIDLSAYPSATLEFLRYVASALDNGEYLRVEVYNGSNWTQVYDWRPPSGNTGRWHAHQLDLTPYRSSAFRVRFTARMNEVDEIVQVDDVRITVPPVTHTRWMTSPELDATQSTGEVMLHFNRWLNIEAPAERKALVQVYDGSTWVSLWESSRAVTDDSWIPVSYDLTPYKNANMRIRFGWSGSGTRLVSGWNIDDVRVRGIVETPSRMGCVAKICQIDPSCCEESWHAGCLAHIADVCRIECSRNATTDECVACYLDPDETIDYDGDGFSPADGDCRECDPTINPGAYDIEGDNIDQDCDGVVDKPYNRCDGALPASGDAHDHARAMGLCRVADERSWGVLEARFVRADGETPCTDSRQYRIMTEFGPGNQPTEGQQMVVYSSGTARARGEPGWIQPDGAGYNAGTLASPPYTIPPAAGCTSGQPGRDSCGLKLKLRAPTNAHSFSFNFNFFTSEYPEWLCTAYNDAFVAYYYGELNTQNNKNISFDSTGNPVSVNNSFFTVPGWPPPSGGSHPKLNGTGFDGVCNNSDVNGTYRHRSICGGATDWLFTTAPVKPGEEFELHFSIWDTGDNQWDSTVLLDNFRWSGAAASIVTGVYDPGEVEPEFEPYYDGWFIRDYDMSTTCRFDQVPVWSLWSWDADTPEDTRIEFFARTASTRGGLETAPQVPLRFSDPPGPAAVNGERVIVRSNPFDTRAGVALVDTALSLGDQPRNLNHLRILMHLIPSADQRHAPTLRRWNLQATCKDAQ